jgi:hypothetical protein
MTVHIPARRVFDQPQQIVEELVALVLKRKDA